MNRRRVAHSQRSLFLVSLAAGGLVLAAMAAQGQETLTTRDGRTLQVRIFGTDDTGIRVQSGNATMSLPFAQVASVTMAPPPSYQAALQAYRLHDLPTALANAKAVAQQFRSLPTDWAESAMSLIGDIYVDEGQLDQAAAAYADFQKAYPGAGAARINVGLARLDVAKKDYASAKSKVDPILAQAMQVRNPPPAASATLGQAYLVSGQVKEAAGDYQGALQDYLSTVTIFPGDEVAVLDAQQRADALRKAHTDAAVP